MQSTFRKAVCSLITFAFTFTSTAGNYALAQGAAERTAQSSATAGAVGTTTGIEDLGKTGNAFGKELGGKIKAGGGPTFDGTNINYQAGGKTYSISKDKLAPSDNGKNIRYAHTAEDFEKQKDLYNDGGQMDETGNQQKDELFADAESPNPTLEGEVYALLVDMAKKDKPDYTGEAFWEKTTEIMGDMENVLQDLVSCDANSALDSQYEYKHIPDIKVCQQVVDRSMSCTIYHDYTAGVLEHVDGPFNMKSCGEGCTEIWLGRVGNDYYPGGSCSLFEESLTFRVLNVKALIKAEIDYAVFDDEFQVWVGPKGRETMAYDSHDGQFPFNDDGSRNGNRCERTTSWAWDVYGDGYGCHRECTNPTPGKGAVDVTASIKSAGKNGVVGFKTRTAVGGNGEGFARMRIRYNPSDIVDNDIWKPKDCVDAATGVSDGMAKGTFTCTNMPTLDSNGCVAVNGVTVCREAMSASPLQGVSPFCRQVEVTTKYDFYKGDTGCWKAMSGFDENGNIIYEEVCGGENLGGNLDTCNQYKDDPNCKFIESKCTPDMTGASGTCYVNDVTYDCGKDVKVNQVEADTKYDCNGIACLGENCIDVERTYSTDFAKINALLNAAQYMAEDMECTGLDEEGKPIGDQNVTCNVFGGTSGYCKIAVGGWQDCCEPIGGPGVAEYISMIMAAQKGHSAIISMSEQIMTPEIALNGDLTLAQEMAGQYADAWGTVADVMKSGVDYLARAFGSTADNVYTFTNYLAAPFEWVKDLIMNQLQEWVKKQLVKILSKIGIDATGGATSITAETPVFQNALNSAFGSAGSAIGSAISVVGWVYLAYQVADIMIQLIYKCEQEEYEMLSKKQAKNCHYVGSYCKDKKLGICIVKHRVYCCFQSPLSRIINEQVKATQGSLLGDQGDWGDPKHPKCNGIPLEKIGEIDWDKINLDEWTALLLSTNNMVTADNIDLERLTGATSKLNWTGSQGILTNLPSAEGNVEVTDKNTENTLPKDPATDAGTATAATFSMMRSRAAVAAADADSGKKPNDRRNTVERTEAKLNNLDVDGLRIESARCMSLVIGNGIAVRGGCGEATNAELYCRKNGALMNCEDIAVQNSLGQLLGNKPSSQDYWDQGYRCVMNDTNIDCSTLYSKEAYIKALEEYAKIIGGTTYLNRYVCLDKSGTFSQAICEHAMEQNYCSCLPGQFICQDGNKEISCAALGATKNDCSCMIGACTEDCQYGGYPKDMADNEALVCSYINSPYGHTVNGTVDKPEILCPYGH